MYVVGEVFIKKYKIILIVGCVFLLTGCQSANDVLKDSLKKNCSNYKLIVNEEFGGGELDYGVIDIGYCDNKIVKTTIDSKSASALSNSYNISIEPFNFPTDNTLTDMFGKSLYRVSSGKFFIIDLVINRYDINKISQIIKNEFIPYISKN